jgi:hypothetical protein
MDKMFYRKPLPPVPRALESETEEEPRRKSVKKWCDDSEPPGAWKGASVAFRAGAKARAAGKARGECRYGRNDLAQAWHAGYDGMGKFLNEGGILLCDQCGEELK